MSKKQIKIINTKYRHEKDKPIVVVGADKRRPVNWSLSIQKSVGFYIQKYDLKCSINDFPIRVNWEEFLTENKVSNEFLDTFYNILPWSLACRTQSLSEILMDKYKNLIDWNAASEYQFFSKEFICEHVDYLNMTTIINSRFLITQEEINEYHRNKKNKEIIEENTSRADIIDI